MLRRPALRVALLGRRSLLVHLPPLLRRVRQLGGTRPYPSCLPRGVVCVRGLTSARCVLQFGIHCCKNMGEILPETENQQKNPTSEMDPPSTVGGQA